MEFDGLEAHGRKDGEGGFSQIHSPYREKEAHYLYLRQVRFTKPGNSLSFANANCTLWPRSSKHLAELFVECQWVKGKLRVSSCWRTWGSRVPKARLA